MMPETTIVAHDTAAQRQVAVHLDAVLRLTADEARRAVNCSVVVELGTGLLARAPELLIRDEQLCWRVPIFLSLPSLGDLGQVGAVEVDALSGDLLLTADLLEAIRRHASHLYAGATLSAE